MYIQQIKSLRDFLELSASMYDIWPEWLANTMIEATIESFTQPDPRSDCASVLRPPYFVFRNGEIVGITGLFADPNPHAFMGSPEYLFLRWTGFYREHRGYGGFREVLHYLCKLALEHQPTVKYLVEVMPVCDYGNSISPIYEAVGFTKHGEPFEVNWSPVTTWQHYVLDINQFLMGG